MALVLCIAPRCRRKRNRSVSVGRTRRDTRAGHSVTEGETLPAATRRWTRTTAALRALGMARVAHPVLCVHTTRTHTGTLAIQLHMAARSALCRRGTGTAATARGTLAVARLADGRRCHRPRRPCRIRTRSRSTSTSTCKRVAFTARDALALRRDCLGTAHAGIVARAVACGTENVAALALACNLVGVVAVRTGRNTLVCARSVRQAQAQAGGAGTGQRPVACRTVLRARLTGVLRVGIVCRRTRSSAVPVRRCHPRADTSASALWWSSALPRWTRGRWWTHVAVSTVLSLWARAATARGTARIARLAAAVCEINIHIRRTRPHTDAVELDMLAGVTGSAVTAGAALSATLDIAHGTDAGRIPIRPYRTRGNTGAAVAGMAADRQHALVRSGSSRGEALCLARAIATRATLGMAGRARARRLQVLICSAGSGADAVATHVRTRITVRQGRASTRGTQRVTGSADGALVRRIAALGTAGHAHAARRDGRAQGLAAALVWTRSSAA